MGLEQILSAARSPIQGVTFVADRAIPLGVDVALLDRLPSVQITGLSSSQVRETAERVRSAIEHSGFQMPRKRITVGISPMGLRVFQGIDLPIALAILAVSEQIKLTRKVLALGELSLSGAVRPVRGAVGAAQLAHQVGLPLVLSSESISLERGEPIAFPAGAQIAAVRDLASAVKVVQGRAALVTIKKRRPAMSPYRSPRQLPQLLTAPYREARTALRAGKPVLLIGAPGSGKSSLAMALASEQGLGRPTAEQLASIARIMSLAGLPWTGHRPFRAPHHSISLSALLGDSRRALPGEVSLANGGVLFLDDAPHFLRPVIEAVRQAHREKGAVGFPSDFGLVMASDPGEEERISRFFPDAAKIKLGE